ncbi:kinase-like domain-containing protein [Boletus reticuloceps]|uniref:Kinase-like domain-containing protein n=1 Tax=Boletus reticuloceps TaxID=495285 RepID=A0A8I2YRV7_9AGAM|nr:kinase-like domain-containing protein [Boletus reticuloceps]
MTTSSILKLIGVTDASSLGNLLLPAYKVVQRMAETYDGIKLGHKRWKVVIQRAALIIKELQFSSRKDRIPVPHLTEFQRRLEDIEVVLQKLADMSFFKALLRFEDINSGIEQANRHLDNCQRLLQIEVSFESQSTAAMSDRDTLRALLRIIAGNYEEIRRRFSIDNDEQEGHAMAALERGLKNAKITSEEDVPLEVQVMKTGLECIKTTTGRSVPKQNKWLITEYDLDFGGTIGGGGFSTVSKARYKGTMVAVKILKDVGLKNMREALEREIDIWSELRHDHIVPFYGASTLTSPFYIVSRYMQNGNLVQYLAAAPDTDCIKLVFEVSLGMYYLHERHIVHGDLKGVNVLVDDAGKACIVDFGLSKVYSSRTAGTNRGKVAGTLRYLAPEALKGHGLSFETDVYAFGMLIYEVFAGEGPFIGVIDDVVWEGRLELQRPTSNKAYERGFNDVLWQLLSECISREPNSRPRFKTIQEQLSSMKKAELPAQSVLPNSPLGLEDIRTVPTDWGLETSKTLPERGKTVSVEEQPNTSSRRTNPRHTTVPIFSGSPARLAHSEPDNKYSLDPKQTTSTPTTLVNNVEPPLKKWEQPSMGQPSVTSTRTTLRESWTPPRILPMCIVVTTKYFGVKFDVSSREPGVYLGETSTIRWQTIKVKKGTLLYEEDNRFYCKSTAGNEQLSWEMDGNDVTLRGTSTVGICRFRDATMAQRWFRLQLNHARGGSVDAFGGAMGDWFYTERGWRRLTLGMIQQAALVQGSPKAVPTEQSWSNISLPKRCIIANQAGPENSIVCITNPGKQSGRTCCKVEGRKVLFETYGDQRLLRVLEETYPSEEYAEMAFRVVRATLERAAAAK